MYRPLASSQMRTRTSARSAFARVSGLEEIVWWILSMGPHCKVIKPKALADRVRELANQTAAIYSR